MWEAFQLMTKEEINYRLHEGIDSLGRNPEYVMKVVAEMLGEIAMQLADLNHHLRVRDGVVQ